MKASQGYHIFSNPYHISIGDLTNISSLCCSEISKTLEF